jgi:hypothetical protein
MKRGSWSLLSSGTDYSMFPTVYGVDFSGARLAGKTIWIARLELRRRRAALAGLWNLERLCGTAERSLALAHLVDRIAASEPALWALDFPFGLPVEVLGPGDGWPAQFDLLDAWGEDAYGLGLECLRRAKTLGGPMHIRRLTDVETRAPFDAYHYRIIFQTFFGMRDVLGPLRARRRTAILPFHYRRLATAERVLVEACPASTLKRLGLPHQNYKQPAGGPLLRKRLRSRHAILEGLSRHLTIYASQRRVIMRNGGGDALDAVIAAVGAAQAWQLADHLSVARHPRYPREGRLFV